MWLKVFTFRNSDKEVIVTVFGYFPVQIHSTISFSFFLCYIIMPLSKSFHKFSSAALPWHNFLSVCLDIQADKGTAEWWTGTHQWYYSKDLQKYSIICDFIQLIESNWNIFMRQQSSTLEQREDVGTWKPSWQTRWSAYTNIGGKDPTGRKKDTAQEQQPISHIFP